MVKRRTALHDLSDLAIRRTMQINSRPTEAAAICVGDEFD